MYRIPYENEQITKTIAAPYAPVDFTEEEKEQFRENIGAGSGGGGGRNLLDNPFFRVNQRNASGAIANREYVADRWIAYESGVIRDGNIVRINAASAYAYIRQNIEPDLKTDLVGNTVTLSFMLEDGQVYSHTFSSIRDNTQNTYSMAILGAGYIDIDTRTPSNIKVLANGVNISILAVKIELGDKSTLENDLPPDYTTELLKCMRYFVRVNGGNYVPLGVGANFSATQARIAIPLPVPMRAYPNSITISGPFFYIVSEGSAHSVISVERHGNVSTPNSNMLVKCNVGSGLTSNKLSMLINQSDTPAYIDFSADL